MGAFVRNHAKGEEAVLPSVPWLLELANHDTERVATKAVALLAYLVDEVSTVRVEVAQLCLQHEVLAELAKLLKSPVELELDDTPLRDLQEARVTFLLALSANSESSPVLLNAATLKAVVSQRVAGILQCYSTQDDLASVETHLEELRVLERFWGAESTFSEAELQMAKSNDAKGEEEERRREREAVWRAETNEREAAQRKADDDKFRVDRAERDAKKALENAGYTAGLQCSGYGV
jgi:hypothetical protein